MEEFDQIVDSYDNKEDEYHGEDWIMISLEPNIYSDLVLTTQKLIQTGETREILTLCASFIVMFFCGFMQFLMVAKMIPDITQPFDDKNILQWGAKEDNKQLHCAGEEWSWYDEQLGDMGDYAQEVLWTTKGQLFGGMALALWMLLIIKEFRKTSKYFLLTRLGEYDPSIRNGFWYDTKTGTWKLDSLGMFARVVIVVAGCWRIFINGYLGYEGAFFLMNTTSLVDFILNSLALGFVQELDEMVFEVALSDKKQDQVNTCEMVQIDPGEGDEGSILMWMRDHTELVVVFITLVLYYTVSRKVFHKISKKLICEAYKTVCPKEVGSHHKVCS